jgi:hypothetical protein
VFVTAQTPTAERRKLAHRLAATQHHGRRIRERAIRAPIPATSRRNTMTGLNRILAILAALAMAVTLGCASTAKSEGTGEYVDDTVITAKVKTAILGESTLKSSEINVETFKGVVQLSGFVNSKSDVNKAVVVAQNVKGVKSVKNDMRVK